MLLCIYIRIHMYTCINTYNVLARVIWPATFARSAGPPGGQNGRTEVNIYINIYRKIIAAVRLGRLAPARPINTGYVCSKYY